MVVYGDDPQNVWSHSGIIVYMDDLYILSSTWESHLKSLDNMSIVLQSADLTLKPPRVVFGPKTVYYLGHVISVEGIPVDVDRTRARQELPTPTSIKELRSVFRVAIFVRIFSFRICQNKCIICWTSKEKLRRPIICP